MKKIVIDDIYTIAEQMVDISAPNKCVSAVGYYDTIQELFNILLKLDDDYEFIGGRLEPEEWNGYDEAWYIEIMDGNDIYIGQMQYDGEDDYILLESDYCFVEEDFLDQYLENNDVYGLTVFGFDDVHNEIQDDELPDCLCMDEDKLGFTFCSTNQYGHQRLRYRSNKKLTESEAWDIIAENFSE